MRVIYSIEEFFGPFDKAIFLAGPTPSVRAVESWRPEALRILSVKGYDGVVFVPEPHDGIWGWSGEEQIDWEVKCLNMADCILFWIPREFKTMPAFVTNVEYGEWFKSGKIILGAPPSAPKMEYLRYRGKKHGVPQAETLEKTIDLALKMVNKKNAHKKVEIVRSAEKISPITDVCGELIVMSSKPDFSGATLAVADIVMPTIPHYHKKITEFYYVTEGYGRLIVGRNTHDLAEGVLAIIPPYKAHYTIPRTELEVLVFAVPAWQEDDQFVLKEWEVEADYSAFKEREELIDEHFRRQDLVCPKDMTREELYKILGKRQEFLEGRFLAEMNPEELRESLRIGGNEY